MLENTSPYSSDDETDSELYVDAVDGEEVTSNQITQNITDTEDNHDYVSTLCIWDNYYFPEFPYEMGVYNQFLETRVVLNNSGRKCSTSCRHLERRTPNISNLEATVLTCKTTSKMKQKPVCSICGRSTIQCTCGTLKKSGSRSPTKLSSQGRSKSGTITRIPAQCSCGTSDRGYRGSPMQLEKSSYFSTQDLQLVHGVRDNKLTEALKRNECVSCDKYLGRCTCAKLKTTKTSGQSLSQCNCNKWKDFFKREETMSIIVVPKDPIRERPLCICMPVKKNEEKKEYKLAGIIEEVLVEKPKTKAKIPQKLIDSREAMEKEQEIKVTSLDPQASSPEPIMEEPIETKLISELTSEPIQPKEEPEQKVIQEPNEKVLVGITTIEDEIITEQITEENIVIEKTTEEIKITIEITEKDKGSSAKIISPAKVSSELEKIELPPPVEELVERKPSDKVKAKNDGKVGAPQPKASPKIEGSSQKEDEKKRKSISKVEEKNKGTKIGALSPKQEKKERKSSLKEDEKNKGTPKIAQLEPIVATQVEPKKKELTKISPSEPRVSLKLEGKGNEPSAIVSTKPTESWPQEKINEKSTKIVSSEPKVSSKLEKDESLPQEKHEKKSSIKLEEAKTKSSIKILIEDEPLPPEKQERKSSTKLEETKTKSSIKIIIEDEPLLLEKQERKSSTKLDEANTKSSIKIVIEEGTPPEGITEEKSKTETSLKIEIVLEESPKINDEESKTGGDSVLITETSIKQSKTSIAVIKKPPVVRKCIPCDSKCKKCSSKIPRITSRVLSKEHDLGKESGTSRLCYCCNAATNTLRSETLEKGEQYQDNAESNYILCKKCKDLYKGGQLNYSSSALMTERKSTAASHDNSRKKGSCDDKRCSRRSSASIRTEKVDRIVSCPKACERPSTASKIYDRKSMEINPICENISRRSLPSSKTCIEIENTSDRKSSKAEISIRREETTIKQCVPCENTKNDLVPKEQEKRLSAVTLNKDKKKKKLCSCHTSKITDRENLVDKQQQCLKKTSKSKSIKCKQCIQAQTGGTLEQDMIASYVASCTNQEIPPPQKFIIQTLLYQFAGYDLNKEGTPQRRRGSLETPKSRIVADSELSVKLDSSMRSIQIQVGPSCPPKCEGAQTVTTFVLADPNADVCGKSSPEAQGRIKYVCGPDVPGIRTKLAVNVNAMQSASTAESLSCACPSEEIDELHKPKTAMECESSVCSYFKNKDAENADNKNIEEIDSKKPYCRILKKDKYVFITVTPVQTEPYEPNYYIIVTGPNEKIKAVDAKTSKSEKICTSIECKKKKSVEHSKIREIPPKVKDPIDRSKKQIFSIETLKSREFLEFLCKKPDLMKGATLVEPPCGPSILPACVAARQQMEVTRECELQCIQSQESAKKVEDTGCGPDTCTNLTKPSNQTPKDESIECCFGNQKITTTTVACGSKSCIHQKELDEERFEDACSCLSADTRSTIASMANKKNNKQVKNMRCGPDICCFKKNVEEPDFCDKTTCHVMYTQTDASVKNRSTEKSPEVAMVSVGCDACCSTEEKKKMEQPEYCEKEVCTNICEKGDLANEVCTKKDYCETDICDNTCEKGETPNEKCFQEEPCDLRCVNEDPVENETCDPSCDLNLCGRIEERGEEDTCISSCDLDLCGAVGDILAKECDDKACPEKNKGQEGREAEMECENIVCPNKNVKPELDEKDLCALELAMNRFIKINPKSVEEE